MDGTVEIKKEEVSVDNATIKTNESDSVIKEFFLKEEGSYVKDLAPLFGQSETELTKEFGVYKAKKVYSKLNYLLNDQNMLSAVILKELSLAVKCSFNSVVVFPSCLGLAKSTLNKSGVKLRALISYPYGEELLKVSACSVKSAIKKGADQVQVFLPVSPIKNGDMKGMLKYVKKLLKTAGKKDVIVTLDAGVLTLPELETAVRLIAKNTTVYAVAVQSSIGDNLVDLSIVKELINSADGRVLIECFSPIGIAEDAVSTLLAGASLVTTQNCPKIATDLSVKIERASGEKAQSLDK